MFVRGKMMVILVATDTKKLYFKSKKEYFTCFDNQSKEKQKDFFFDTKTNLQQRSK